MRILMLLQNDAWSMALSRLDGLGRDAQLAALNVAFAIVVVLAGWALAWLLSALVRIVLRWVRFDDGVRRLIGVPATRHEPAHLMGQLVFWGVLVAAGLLALDALGLPVVPSVASRLVEVVPRIVTSAVLFVIGSLIALLVGGVAQRFLESLDVRASRVFGQVVVAVLTGFSALLALEQLGFAAQFVMAIGVVALGSAGLALALAFGLGCRDLARDFIVEYLRALDDGKPRRPQ